MSYWRFAAMIATSTVVMFGLMYLNTWAWEHVFFSETRLYMALLMGATMAVIMLSYMLGMYRNMALNLAIFAGSILVFAATLWLVRSQATVSGSSYMRAMIPHHSIAIMTSERAQINDPRVRKLADEIIGAQEREIAEMRYLIGVLDRRENDLRPEMPGNEPQPEIVTMAQALSRPAIAKVDPEPMAAAEAGKALPAGPQCDFAYTADGDAVLAVSAPAREDAPPQGVIKIKGALVALAGEGRGGYEAVLAGPALAADGVRLAVVAIAGEEPEETAQGRRRIEADMVLEIDGGLRAGYRGFYTCDRTDAEARN